MPYIIPYIILHIMLNILLCTDGMHAFLHAGHCNLQGMHDAAFCAPSA